MPLKYRARNLALPPPLPTAAPARVQAPTVAVLAAVAALLVVVAAAVPAVLIVPAVASARAALAAAANHEIPVRVLRRLAAKQLARGVREWAC